MFDDVHRVYIGKDTRKKFTPLFIGEGFEGFDSKYISGSHMPVVR